MDDTYFLKEAVKEANVAFVNNEVPVGAIIVKNNIIIGRGHNCKCSTNIATNHAEIIAINAACKFINSYKLDDCIIYVTLMPCKMCLGAIEESRIDHIVYIIDSTYNSNHKKITINKASDKFGYKHLLSAFFKNKR